MKDLLITAALAIIMLVNAVDVVTDIGLGVPLWHIIEEGVIVLISAVAVAYLLLEMRRRTQKLNHLVDTLSVADQQLQNITSEMKNARKMYSETIHHQFDEWRLTQSEQQVALLLLKGLSFKEIAAVRTTREKTVRQQASTLYGKSGLEGRHEFSAWFLEDFLAEKPVSAAAAKAS
jgi:DNA-binding NarL/FixJ family response regulator